MKVPGPAQSPAIEATGLTVTDSDSRLVLDDLTFAVAPGERVLLVGASGSGKSTLLRMIAGLPFDGDLVASGSLRVNGIEVLGATMTQIRRDTGWVPQDPAAAVCLPVVSDDVAFPCENMAVPADRIDPMVDRALHRVRAFHLREHDTGTLSDGQAQRIGMATATVTGPSVLLLDEPTSMLDPIAMHAVHGVIGDLRGAALLLVEHRLDELAEQSKAMPERTILLSGGRIVADGPTGHVLTEQAHLVHASGCWLPWRIEVTIGGPGPGPGPGPGRGPGLVSGARSGLESGPGSGSGLVSGAGSGLVKRPGLVSGPGPEVLGNHGARRFGGDQPADVLVSAKNLSVGYSRPLLSDVNLTLRAGEIAAVVGANGSGKSTLLRTLAGLHRPIDGRIQHSGGRPGLVFQNPEHQFVAPTVREEIGWGGVDPGAVDRALDEHDLTHLADRRPFRLSGGQKRRVSLAAMAVGNRRVLLADEPMFGLDRVGTRAVQQTLREAADRQGAVLFSCHDLRIVVETADRLLVLGDGRVLADGDPRELLRSQSLRAAAGLRLPPSLAVLGTDPDLPESPGLSDRLGLSDEPGLADRLGLSDEPGLGDELGLADELGLGDELGLADEPGLPDEAGLATESAGSTPGTGAVARAESSTPRPPVGIAPADPGKYDLLSRRNPLAGLAVLVAVSVAAFFVLDPATTGVLYLLALAGVLFAGRLPVRVVVRAHLAFGSFAMGIFLVNAFTRPGRTVLDLGFARLSDAGISVGAALALRVLLIGTLATGFAIRTDPVRLIVALHQHARLSPRFGYAILTGHRMLAALPEQWRTLLAAHRMRAPLDRRGRPRSGPRVWMRAAFGLLVVTIRRGERIAGSLEARGLGTGPRTIRRPVPFAATDAAFVVVCFAMTAAVIVGSGLLGSLHGLGVLFG